MQKIIASVAVIAGANAIEVEAQRSPLRFGPDLYDHHAHHGHHGHHGHVEHHYAVEEPHEQIGNDGYIQKERGFAYGEPSKPIYAKCQMKDPEEEADLGGTIEFEQWPGQSTKMWGEIWGITPGPHGFHIHALGDLRGGCASTGGHFDPNNAHSHGAHTEDEHHRHAGDLEQAYADEYGTAVIEQKDMLIDLYGGQSIIGRSLVIHSKKDDLGKGGDAGSKASGNSGARIGCCTIGLAAGPEPKYEAKPAYDSYEPHYDW